MENVTITYNSYKNKSYAPCLAIPPVKVSKYSKFGVDTFNTFKVLGFIKVFALRRQLSSDHNSSTFLRNIQAKSSNNFKICQNVATVF